MGIPAIFAAWGEERFRMLETEALKEAGKKSGAVIATGGGVVTVPENRTCCGRTA
jgi:shikimate kinase